MVRHALTVVFAVSVLAAIAPGAFAQDDARYQPAAFEREPGQLFYMFQQDAFWEKGVFAARKQPTTDCVTPPSALQCYFPPVDGPAGWLELDLNQALPREEGSTQPPIPADAVALAFYVKGDGSSGFGRVELRGDDNNPGPAFEFPLADASWHWVAIAWDKFTPVATSATATMLAFGLKEDTKRPASYTIDALRVVKTADENAELAKLAAAANANKAPIPAPYRPGPAACAYNKSGLAAAREKVRRGEALKWLAYGDSVTVPVQLWNIPEKYRPKYAYYRVAADFLESEFHTKIDITVNAVGGRQLNENFDELGKALAAAKPDVLIMHPWDTLKNYQIYMPKAAAAAREAGAEVVVMVPVYDAFEYRDPAIDWLRRFCIENNIACVDARTYLLSPGTIYWGELFANPFHPDPEGHRLMGQVLAEMFR